jgi:molybdate/tungstate transport system substrate-binding protein
MVCELADDYYADNTIFEKVMGDFSPPITVSDNLEAHVIAVPETLKPKKVIMRGYSVTLLSLLESGDLDYSFEYESVARQHGLGFVELPPEIDLSSRDFSDRYGKVMVKMDFQRFSSINPEFHGEPIQYALTIPSNSPHQDAAIQFVEFLLGSDGQRVFLESYQPMLALPEPDNLANVPAGLGSLLGE